MPQRPAKPSPPTAPLGPLLAAIVGLALAVGAARAAEPLAEAEVVARVNGEVILAGDLLWEVELLLQQRLAGMPAEQRAAVPPEELAKARRQMMQQLLASRMDMTLFYADFRAKTPMADLDAIHESIDPRFLKQEIPMLMKIVGAEDLPELKTKLHAVGTSLDERRQAYYRKAIAQAWLTETVEFDREVTHEQMLAAYRADRDEYAFPARARWEEIAVRFDRFADKASAYRAIAVVGNRAYASVAAQGADTPAFETIARESSHGLTAAAGGQHDWTTRGSLAADTVDAALFTLPPGQMSPILEGPTGFHIVRVLEREDAGVKPFRDVQTSIKRRLRDQRRQVAIEARVREIKQGAHYWTVFTGDLDTSRVAERPGAATR